MPLNRPLWIATTLTLACAAVVSAAWMPPSPARAEGKAAKHKDTPRAKRVVTYAKDIAPILYQNCASCHRTGEIGPFALMSYTDAKKRAAQLVSVTESRFMPPWHADSHGEFRDERKLTPEQIATIREWVAAGSPEGSPSAVPAPPKFPQGWSLGKPDLTLEPTKAYTLAAEGGDVYRCFVIPSGQTEDRYVAAIEVRPGNAKVVHHVIAYLDVSGKAKQVEAQNKDGQPGYTSYGGIGTTPSGALGGWAPGNLPRLLPDGVGTLLPKGSDVVLQVHYHRSGKAETDQTRIGIYFCKKPVDKRMRILPVFGMLSIPAGEANYTVHGFPMNLGNDATILGVMPHMHLLGHDMTVTATMPDNSKKTLVHVPNYDFNWQTTYMYKEPVKVAAGTRVGLTAHYDNSSSNPRNPNRPPKQIGWGEQTTDEMCIAFVYYTIDKEELTKGITFVGGREFGRKRQSTAVAPGTAPKTAP
jgi:mono/diheme cytochrome c family protein